MHLPGNIRVSRFLRRLRSRMRPGIAILGYHRVSPDAHDPLGLSVGPAHFAEHLAVVKRLGQPMRLAEAAAAIPAGRLPERAIVFTFDDGYADNLHTVLPLLERHDVPATMFVTSGDRGGEFWWDRLVRVSSAGSGADRRIGELAVELERLPESEREARLQAIECNIRVVSNPAHRSLTIRELQTLAASPLIELGAHGVSHQPLPTLPVARQREETARCRQVIEDLIGRPVMGFAYPHGALTAETVACVREAGYAYACCSKVDVASASAAALTLPRLWVKNWDGSRFEQWLRGWLHGA